MDPFALDFASSGFRCQLQSLRYGLVSENCLVVVPNQRHTNPISQNQSLARLWRAATLSIRSGCGVAANRAPVPLMYESGHQPNQGRSNQDPHQPPQGHSGHGSVEPGPLDTELP